MMLLAVVGFLLVGTLITQLVLQTRQRDARNDLLTHVDPARVRLGDLRAAVIDQESGVRSFALTDDPGFLEQYRRGRQAAGAARDRLDELVGDRPAVVRELEMADDRVDAWETGYAEPAVAAGEAGLPQPPALALEGKALADQMRASIDDVDVELNALRAAAIDDLDDAARRATAVLVV